MIDVFEHLPSFKKVITYTNILITLFCVVLIVAYLKENAWLVIVYILIYSKLAEYLIKHDYLCLLIQLFVLTFVDSFLLMVVSILLAIIITLFFFKEIEHDVEMLLLRGF